MRSKRSPAAGLLVGLLPVVVAAGCGDSTPDTAGDVPPSATASGSEPATTPPSASSSAPSRLTLPPQPPLPTRPVETTVIPPAATQPNADDLTIATADLAERLGVDASSIEVVAVERVTWSDGSVGCPQPGMNYTQALVPGSRIVLRSGGVAYAYHAADGRAPFYCPASQATAPTPNPDI